VVANSQHSKRGNIHRYQKAKIDCLSLFMCPLLAQLKIGFFSSFSAAAVYSTNETNKAGLKQSVIFRCLWKYLRGENLEVVWAKLSPLS